MTSAGPVPDKPGAEYTPEEQARFREEFRPLAARYRRRVRLAYGVVVVGVAALALGFALPGRAGGWAAGVFLVCWAILFGWMVFRVRLLCPGCSGDMEGRRLGPYCPVCGHRSLSSGDWLQATRCTDCGKRLRRGRQRFYKIRACTHCGLVLDERGL